MIELILATDMSRHTEIMEKFKSILTQGFDYNTDEHRKMVTYRVKEEWRKGGKGEGRRSGGRERGMKRDRWRKREGRGKGAPGRKRERRKEERRRKKGGKEEEGKERKRERRKGEWREIGRCIHQLYTKQPLPQAANYTSASNSSMSP